MNQGAVISAGVWGVSGGTSVPGSCPRPAWDSAGFAAAVVSLVKKYVENLKNHSATKNLMNYTKNFVAVMRKKV